MKSIIWKVWGVAAALVLAACTLGGEEPAEHIPLIPASPTAPDVGDDVKIAIQSSAASAAQQTEGIARSHDGSLNTHYHSPWSNTTFPVTLTYTFQEAGSMDYLLYYVRTDGGSNGNFQEFELWVEAGAGLVKYGDYNFNGGSGRINFEPPLNNPAQIQFKVLSGVGGFASCAEMEFYRKAPLSFDCLSIFTDLSCSAIKAGVTRDAINAIPDAFFKNLALRIFLGQYDAEFRVQQYRAWEHPDTLAAANKTSPYSLRDNPTGIFIEQNEDLIVFVSALQGQHLSLVSQDLSSGGWGTQRSYLLTSGLNKLTAVAKGLLYVQYYSDDGENAPRITVHIATGAVNGYFDIARHASTDWQRRLNNAVADDFDLVGEKAHLTFPVAKFKTHTPDGASLVAGYDTLVRLEQEFMGLYKYNRVYPNRVYFHADYNHDSSFMYATSYHTGYSMRSLDSIINRAAFITSGIWGPAHEVGHVHQIRPGLKWAGMTEVTTNIYSLHVQTSLGLQSRLITDNVYQRAFTQFLGKGIAHNNFRASGSPDLWAQLVPFWQLKLYLVDALDKTDFYQDLIHHFMTSPDPGTAAETDGRFQLDFVRQVCDTAELNLLDFFEQWGFLTPLDITLNDYGNVNFKITQAQINSLKSEIQAKGYAPPPRDFTRITDANAASYR